jgi:hypothetical protein
MDAEKVVEKERKKERKRQIHTEREFNKDRYIDIEKETETGINRRERK